MSVWVVVDVISTKKEAGQAHFSEVIACKMWAQYTKTTYKSNSEIASPPCKSLVCQVAGGGFGPGDA
jgi:hypothetical protein